MVKEEWVQGETVAMLPADLNQLMVYSTTSEIPKDVRDAIAQAIQLKQAVIDVERQIDARTQQIAEITAEQNRIRENMKTVAPSTPYYERLLAKLNEQESSIRSCTYARSLGLFSGTMLVVGGIIGSGIFINPSIVAARTGSAALTIGIWSLGAVIALLGAFIFAELGRRRPEVGGGYAYLRDAFGPLPAFLYGWALLLAIATGAIAAVAVTFANYFTKLVGMPPESVKPARARRHRALVRGERARREARCGDAEHLHTAQARGAGGAVDRRALSQSVRRADAPATDRERAVAAPDDAARHLRRDEHGARARALLVWRMAADELRRRGDARSGEDAAARAGPRRAHRRRRVSRRERRVPARARRGGARGEQRAGGGSHGDGGRRRRATADRGGHRGVHLRLSQSRDSRVAARLSGDGARWSVLRRLREAASALSHARHWRSPFRRSWPRCSFYTGGYGQLLDWVVFADWIFFGTTALTLVVFRRRDAAAGVTDSGFRAPFYPVSVVLFVMAALYVVFGSIASNPWNAMRGMLLLLAGVPVYLFWKSAANEAERGLGLGLELRDSWG